MFIQFFICWLGRQFLGSINFSDNLYQNGSAFNASQWTTTGNNIYNVTFNAFTLKPEIGKELDSYYKF